MEHRQLSDCTVNRVGLVIVRVVEERDASLDGSGSRRRQQVLVIAGEDGLGADDEDAGVVRYIA